MICLRGALPNLRSAHSFATRQLIGGPQDAQRRANFVQVLYENFAISAKIDQYRFVSFCKLSRKAL
jgi:hypothetical protein